MLVREVCIFKIMSLFEQSPENLKLEVCLQTKTNFLVNWLVALTTCRLLYLQTRWIWVFYECHLYIHIESSAQNVSALHFGKIPERQIQSNEFYFSYILIHKLF